MTPFWKKPGKKKAKTKQKSSSQKLKQPSQPRPRPEPWKPPEKIASIPQIDFKKAAHKEKSMVNAYHGRKEFIKTFKQLTYTHSKWQVWSDFITMFACTISNAVDKRHFDEREKLYLDAIRRYSKKEQPLFSELSAHVIVAMEENQDQDFLGSIFMELDLGNEHKGQFFTPYSVCQLMAAMAEGDLVAQVKEKGYITIGDPCCGAGATIIAGVNEAKHQLEKAGFNFQNHILVVGQDIDFTVMAMCYIQLSLLGVAGYFKLGNSLSEPMTNEDSLENYWFTPMYFSDVWAMRWIAHKMDALLKTGESDGH